MSYISGMQLNLRETLQDDGGWLCEFVDGLGKVMEDFPKFYSRYSCWARAHALQYYADELYRIKYTTTPLG